MSNREVLKISGRKTYACVLCVSQRWVSLKFKCVAWCWMLQYRFVAYNFLTVMLAACYAPTTTEKVWKKHETWIAYRTWLVISPFLWNNFFTFHVLLPIFQLRGFLTEHQKEFFMCREKSNKIQMNYSDWFVFVIFFLPNFSQFFWDGLCIVHSQHKKKAFV